MIPDYFAATTDQSPFQKKSKIFEKVIHCRLNLFLEQNSCLYPFQFGFWLNYSTNNVLMVIVESIKKQLYAAMYTDIRRLQTECITTFYLGNLITVV